MAPLVRRVAIIATSAVCSLFLLVQFSKSNILQTSILPVPPPPRISLFDVNNLPPFKWRDLSQQNPVDLADMFQLPNGPAAEIPQIQHAFEASLESDTHKEERQRRLAAVKVAFKHSWSGYRNNAWLHDEVRPMSGHAADPFGGWAATLVDTLDTLWIMGLQAEFEEAVNTLDSIDFSTSSVREINVFETTIRYLGGFLSAYDLSDGQYPMLLQKAEEVAELLYRAFDTPNRMPITRWNWAKYLDGEIQIAPTNEIIAELGSFTLEFTRLSQITGDPKWFDAAQRIMNAFESEQSKTLIPGLWPVGVNPLTLNLHTDKKFTVGAMADSVFEYLSKAHLLLSGRTPSYSTMHILMTEATKSFLTFEPLLPPSTTTQRGLSPLMLGNVAIDGKGKRILEPQGQHLVCFAGGMFALGARALSDSLPSAQYHEDMTVARRLTDGCIWSYYATNLGIGPELFYTLPCRLGRDAVTNGSEPDGTGKNGNCDWNEARWHAGLRGVPGPVKKAVNGLSDFVRDHNLEGGFTQIQDPSYGLRPEAIESVFILYRTTGDTALQDHAWNMFSAIDHYAKTSIAHAAIANVMDKPGMIMLYNEDGTEKGPAETIQHKDNMESFWTAETLKYFYLVFEDTDVVSLDGFVFNTEAHPLRWRNERGRSRGSST